jgi:hypothetical protein
LELIVVYSTCACALALKLAGIEAHAFRDAELAVAALDEDPSSVRGSSVPTCTIA